MDTTVIDNGDIDAFLSREKLCLVDDNASREQGFLNAVYFVQDAQGKKYVLRAGRADNREDIETYIRKQIKVLGAEALGARLAYRGMEEQTIFMRHLAAKGISVPPVERHGPDWMLMHFVEGKSLKNILAEMPVDQAWEPVQAVLNAFMDVHKKGECLWDRWGGNELIDGRHNVCFLDFDINIIWPSHVPVRVKAALDLAFMLRGCLQFSQDPETMGHMISETISARRDFSEIYDTAALSCFLEGQIRFYEDEYCRNTAVAPLEQERQAFINRCVKNMRGTIEAVPNRGSVYVPDRGPDPLSF